MFETLVRAHFRSMSAVLSLYEHFRMQHRRCWKFLVFNVASFVGRFMPCLNPANGSVVRAHTCPSTLAAVVKSATATTIL